MLTPKQRAALVFIDRYTREHGGVSPSFVEIAAAIEVTTKSSVHRVLACLQERGFIRRTPGHARAIEVLRIPQHPVASDLTAYTDEQLFAEIGRREAERLKGLVAQIRKAERRG